MKTLITKYWLYGVLGLQFILLVTMFWFFQSKITGIATVVNNQGAALTQIINFIQQNTQK